MHSEKRRIAFFWIGHPKEYMLGLWEKPAPVKSHFAFRCDLEDILHRSVNWLKERNLQPYNFLKDGTEQPMVFAWMPAIAIYFNDPDGNILEFIAVLDGNPRPELGIITYDAWLKIDKGTSAESLCQDTGKKTLTESCGQQATNNPQFTNDSSSNRLLEN